MLTTILAGIAVTAALTAAGGLTVQGIGSKRANDKLQAAYKNYKEAIKGTEAEDLDIEEALGNLRASGKITEKDYSRYLNDYKDFEKQLADKNGDEFWSFWQSGKKMNEAIDMYNLLAENYPDFSRLSKLSLTDALKTSGILAADAPTPKFLQVDEMPEMQGAELAKLWSAQELADLHKLNIDSAHYYDLIKQGTTANKNLAAYQAEQSMNTAGLNDTVDSNTYLNNIRNIKSESIANGATMGARAANELLANRDAVANKIKTTNEVYDNAYNSMLSSVRADADARLTARNYTNSLLQSLANDINTLYSNDAMRYGQDILSSAEKYTSDLALRDAQLKANADMEAAYRTAQASINAGNSNISNYAYLFDNILMPKNDNNATKSLLELADYVKQNQTGLGRFATIQNELNKN